MRIAIPLAFLLGIFVAVTAPAQGDESEGPVSAETLRTFMTETKAQVTDLNATIDTLRGQIAALEEAGKGVAAEATSGEGPSKADLAAQEKAMEAMAAELAYLRSREAATSAYVNANAARADALVALTAKCRDLGFTKRAIPANSREALLAGFDGLATSLREGLPAVTPEEQALLGKAAKLRKE